MKRLQFDRSKSFDRFTYVYLLELTLSHLWSYWLRNSSEYKYLLTRWEQYSDEEYEGKDEYEIFDFSHILDHLENNEQVFAYVANRLKFDLRGNGVLLPILINYLNK
jgi:hypothetical protein